MKVKVLSIDAWGNQDDGYEWNNLFKVGEVDSADIPDDAAGMLAMMREHDYMTDKATLDTVEVEESTQGSSWEDGCIVTFNDKATGEPLFALSTCH